MSAATLSQLAIVRSAALRELLGGISAMTLHRWQNRPTNPLPAAHTYPGSRTKFWYVHEIETYLASGQSSGQASGQPTASATANSV
jgi:hypothetical protein